MKQGIDGFSTESTPVLNVKKPGAPKPPSEPVKTVASPVHWKSDNTEVYTDFEEDEAVASLIAPSGESYPISRFPFILGRGEDCDLVLYGKGVSRQHAEIVLQSGHFVINDLKSLNGVKVNGYKVARVILEEGDSIRLGEVALTFQPGAVAADGSTGLSDSGFSVDAAPRAAAVVAGGHSGGIMRKAVSGTLLVLGVAAFGLSCYLYVNQKFGGAGEPELAATGAVPAVSGAPSATGSAQPLESASATAVESEAQPAAQQSGFFGAGADSVALNAEAPAAAPSESGQTDELVPASLSADAAPASIAQADSGVEESGLDSRLDALAADEVAEPAEESVDAIAAIDSSPDTVEVSDSEPPTLASLSTPSSEVAAPSKPAPIANKNSQAVVALSRANTQYLQGRATPALETLAPYLNVPSVTGSARIDVRERHDQISGLLAQYVQARDSLAGGNIAGGVRAGAAFVASDKAAYPRADSELRNLIIPKLANAYVKLGNAANQSGDTRNAYTYWQKAVALNGNQSARAALSQANGKAQDLYREALRLEYFDAEKARALWQDVTRMVPQESEYHQKASAKLEWYRQWDS